MGLQAKRVNEAVTLLASTATAAGAVDTNSSAVRLPGMVNAFAFTLDVTAAATDAGDTLDVTIQTKLDGTNWVDVVHFTQHIGTTAATRYIEKVVASPVFAGFEVGTALAAGEVRDLIGDDWRVNYVQVDAGGQNASFTFSVIACPM